VNAKVLRREQLNRKLAALPQAVKDKIRAGLSQSAEEIVNFAKGLVPIATGELRNSIGWTFGKAPRGSIALAQTNAGDVTVTVYAGNDQAFYARWVEFGTQKTRAQPYFFVSYRALKKRSKSRVSRSINQAAKQVASGG